MALYVIGHKNPDTDAICSAIAYADLLQKTTHPEAIPACCGQVNLRTAYVLEQAGVPAPKLLMDVNPTANSISRKNIHYARMDEPFLEVYRRMQRHRLRNIPVLDKDQRVVGLLPLLNLLHLLLPDEEDIAEHRRVETSLGRIRNVLGGTYQNDVNHNVDENLLIMIGAMSAEGFTERLYRYPADQVILISGDRPTIHDPAIEYGVRCIVITGGFKMAPEVLEKAKANHVAVICSPYDTAMTSMLIKGAKLIDKAIDRNFISLKGSDRLQEITVRLRHENQDLYPVVDSEDMLVGVLSKSDLIEPEYDRLILVDHNEYGQAVKGAKEAEIVEVIDHHRLGGGLVTREPIRFINDIVGSTCTIVARMYRQRAVIPEPGIALCMVAGIVSDTLNLTSPTTTDVDRDILSWLEPHAGVDVDSFSHAFFNAGSVLASLSMMDAVSMDCKEYEENGWRISVAQVEELGMDKFWSRKASLEEALSSFCDQQGLDFSCLMITDITKHVSLLLTVGSHKINNKIGYPAKETNLFQLSGVVSRKKQLLPHLVSVMNKVVKEDV